MHHRFQTMTEYAMSDEERAIELAMIDLNERISRWKHFACRVNRADVWAETARQALEERDNLGLGINLERSTIDVGILADMVYAWHLLDKLYEFSTKKANGELPLE